MADLRRHAAFGFVRVVTFWMMSNHFHVLVEVPARPSDEEVARIFPNDDALERHVNDTHGGQAGRKFAQARRLADTITTLFCS